MGRKTELDKAIDNLTAQIVALSTARDLLEEQRALMRRPALKPPQTATDAPWPATGYHGDPPDGDG